MASLMVMLSILLWLGIVNGFCSFRDIDEDFLEECPKLCNKIEASEPKPICCERCYRVDEDITPIELMIEDTNTGSCGRGYPAGYLNLEKNDSLAQYNEFPWTAALFQIGGTPDGSMYICGGSLIHPRVILTAAHCVRNISQPEHLMVRLGEWDLASENELYDHRDFAVQKIIKHDLYHVQKYHNDLALLVLDKPATLDQNINTVCLPKVGESFNGKRCVAVGWGKTAQNGTYSEVLKKVELPVVEHQACQRMLRQTALGPIFRLHAGFLCAGGEAGVDTCQGDGGAPLMCDRGDGSHVQAGIVAWGIGCANENIPGVYVQVAKYREWIEEQLKLLDFSVDVRSG